MIDPPYYGFKGERCECGWFVRGCEGKEVLGLRNIFSKLLNFAYVKCVRRSHAFIMLYSVCILGSWLKEWLALPYNGLRAGRLQEDKEPTLGRRQRRRHQQAYASHRAGYCKGNNSYYFKEFIPRHDDVSHQNAALYKLYIAYHIYCICIYW